MPRHLEAVPIDAFDGGWLRYDRTARLVWSVGSDFRDRHGQQGECEGPLLEPAFAI